MVVWPLSSLSTVTTHTGSPAISAMMRTALGGTVLRLEAAAEGGARRSGVSIAALFHAVGVEAVLRALEVLVSEGRLVLVGERRGPGTRRWRLRRRRGEPRRAAVTPLWTLRGRLQRQQKCHSRRHPGLGLTAEDEVVQTVPVVLLYGIDWGREAALHCAVLATATTLDHGARAPGVSR